MLKRLSKIRELMFMDHPFYGSLALNLEIRDRPVGTACTDGTYLDFDPAFVSTLDNAELTGLFAHEVAHCELQHMFRGAGRDQEIWNSAADYVINARLIADGFTLPAGALLDPRFDQMHAEQVYAILQLEQDQTGNPPPTGNGSTGSFREPDPTAQPDPNDPNGGGAGPVQLGANDWQILAEQAANVASKAGELPGGVKRDLDHARGAGADWRAILRELIEHTAPSNYSFTRPARRHMANGVYLPGVVKENMPPLYVAIDNSGSVSKRDLSVFARELTAILHDLKPERIELIYCDTRIRKTQTVEQWEPELTLSADGGGGTKFMPVFDHLQESGEYPAALVYFTDLDNSPEQVREPDYPVLWITSERVTRIAEFGQTVRISFD